MDMIVSINGKSGSTAQSVYTLRDLRKMARALVMRRKVIGLTLSFDERTGTTRLIVSYETAPNEQTFATMAI